MIVVPIRGSVYDLLVGRWQSPPAEHDFKIVRHRLAGRGSTYQVAMSVEGMRIVERHLSEIMLDRSQKESVRDNVFVLAAQLRDLIAMREE